MDSAHNPPGAQPKEQITPVTKSAGSETKQVHINPATQRPARGAETRAHTPHDDAGWAPAHKPTVQTVNLGELRVKCTQPCDTEGAEGSPHKSLQCGRIHTSTYLASFGQQRRAGQGNRGTSNDPRDRQGTGGTELC